MEIEGSTRFEMVKMKNTGLRRIISHVLGESARSTQVAKEIFFVSKLCLKKFVFASTPIGSRESLVQVIDGWRDVNKLKTKKGKCY